MPNPSYSFNGIAYTELPGYYRLGGRPQSSEDRNIELETDSGVEFIYNQFSRDVIEIVFNVLADDLGAFRTLHTLAVGSTYPFYFSVDGTGVNPKYVRKEAGFDPVELPTKGALNALYEYVLRLRTALV